MPQSSITLSKSSVASNTPYYSISEAKYSHLATGCKANWVSAPTAGQCSSLSRSRLSLCRLSPLSLTSRSLASLPLRITLPSSTSTTICTSGEVPLTTSLATARISTRRMNHCTPSGRLTRRALPVSQESLQFDINCSSLTSRSKENSQKARRLSTRSRRCSLARVIV